MEAWDMGDASEWVCECRRCNGVRRGIEAVQYVWEWVLGSCGVPIVVGVHADPSGHVVTAWTYWEDEPDVPFELPGLTQFMVSVRPGRGTLPTEGDVARWVAWQQAARAPADWMIADGLRTRSVGDVVTALRAREPMADERQIAGDSNGLGLDEKMRAEVRATWAQTKRDQVR